MPRECRVDRLGNCVESTKEKIFTYHVNFDERGDFYADVRDSKDHTVFEIKVEAGTESETNNIFGNGFMKHTTDISGLEEYLKSLKAIPENSRIIVEK